MSHAKISEEQSPLLTSSELDFLSLVLSIFMAFDGNAIYQLPKVHLQKLTVYMIHQFLPKISLSK